MDVTFHADGDGTRVEVVHSGWDRIGTRAKHGMEDFSTGWDPVMKSYAAHAAA